MAVFLYHLAKQQAQEDVTEFWSNNSGLIGVLVLAPRLRQIRSGVFLDANVNATVGRA
jgi:hypothetical protein